MDKGFPSIQKEPDLSLNALKVLERRYLLKDDNRNVVEKPQGLFKRVAQAVSLVEDSFKDKQYKRIHAEEKFFEMMRNLEFIPNSPTLMNAGTKMGQLSACFVLPISDSIESIFKALRDMAIIHQTGGGTGFDFSSLRPKGGVVYSTKGEASGPVSFMSIYDTACGVIVQGGRRRGANMGILRIDHPDIVEFIEAKLKEGLFSNFNLSVALTDEFMQAVYKNRAYQPVNPRTKQAIKELKANEAQKLDWDKLSDRIKWGVRFLDDIIEVNKFPLPQIQDITFKNRKIGLGVMGFADILVLLGMPYNSKGAVKVEDVRNIYVLAYELKCKGITIYRYGTKKEQVLNFCEQIGTTEKIINVASEYSGGGCAGEVCA